MIYKTLIKEAICELLVCFIVKTSEKYGIYEYTAHIENIDLIFKLVIYSEECCVSNLLVRIEVFRDIKKR